MAYFHYFSDVTCPKCQHLAHFSLLHAAAHRDPHQQAGVTQWADSSTKFHGIFTCGYCRNPQAMDFTLNRNSPKPMPAYPMNFLNRLNFEMSKNQMSSASARPVMTLNTDDLGHNLRTYFSITNQYGSENDVIPKHLPAFIEDLVINDLLQVTGSPRHVVISCRALLEAACKDKLGSEGGKLVSMIQQLHSQGFITSALANLAHSIRMIGNEAVHQSEPVPLESANEIKDFTMLLLELLYTYPARTDLISSQ
ncbi:DUF4145 domain-containing protein [Aeromonas enteropelogenes]|uniref:DUF4145 domain-containing protein n=1 Tax=Aeromonas enteropelogenes TaxID=29489 RepID=UPI003BA21243